MLARPGAGCYNRPMIQSLSVGPIGANTYIVDQTDGPLLVFDPGAEANRILRLILTAIKRGHQDSVLLVCTHGHLDHTGGLPELTASLRDHGIKHQICVHADDVAYFGAESVRTNQRLFDSIQASAFFDRLQAVIPAPDLLLQHDSLMPGTDVRVLHTPGHSPGSCCFLIEHGRTLISGDTLFKGGRGRTDSFDASEDSLLRSIRERLCNLPESTRVLPGHGGETTIGKERRHYL